MLVKKAWLQCCIHTNTVLVEKADFAFMIIAHKQERVQARDPLLFEHLSSLDIVTIYI